MENVLNQLCSALSQVCQTVTEFPGVGLKRPGEPIMAVGIKSAQASGAASYLGVTGQDDELYGLTVRAEFSLDIFAPGGRGDGAAQCRRLFNRALEILSLRLSSGLKITTVSCGQLYYDGDAAMYRLPCVLSADAFVYAAADESGQFVDFDLRGVTYSG